MMIVTNRLDASDTLLREVRSLVERIDCRLPPPPGKETDSSFDYMLGHVVMFREFLGLCCIYIFFCTLYSYSHYSYLF